MNSRYCKKKKKKDYNICIFPLQTETYALFSIRKKGLYRRSRQCVHFALLYLQ